MALLVGELLLEVDVVEVVVMESESVKAEVWDAEAVRVSCDALNDPDAVGVSEAVGEKLTLYD